MRLLHWIGWWLVSPPWDAKYVARDRIRYWGWCPRPLRWLGVKYEDLHEWILRRIMRSMRWTLWYRLWIKLCWSGWDAYLAERRIPRNERIRRELHLRHAVEQVTAALHYWPYEKDELIDEWDPR